MTHRPKGESARVSPDAVVIIVSVDTGIARVRSAVQFVWASQVGLFELAYYPNRRTHYTKSAALNCLGGNRYFAPLARKTRGSKKENVADVGNMLWADIDSLGGLTNGFGGVQVFDFDEDAEGRGSSYPRQEVMGSVE
jgi:hypothetical protein